jgi:hypothetical protein
MRVIINISLVFLLLGCDPLDERLILSNNTSEVVFYMISSSEKLDGKSPFKNSFKVINRDTVWDETSNLILPSSDKIPVVIGRNGWTDFVKDSEDGRLRVFVFEKDLISKISWKGIIADQKFSKKYELTLEELERLNWQIKYEKKLEASKDVDF